MVPNAATVPNAAMAPRAVVPAGGLPLPAARACTLRVIAVVVAGGLAFGSSGCGGGSAEASPPSSFSVTLPDLQPLSRSDIERLKSELAKDDGHPPQLPVSAAVFAFDGDVPNISDPEWVALIGALVDARPVALDNGWHIEVDGYTDTIGGAEYNQGLSERRARAAAAEIVSAASYPSEKVLPFGRGEGGGGDGARRVVVRFERSITQEGR